MYSQSQPGLWAKYLFYTGRNDEVIQFARTAYPTVDPKERPELLNNWGNALVAKGASGAMRQALPLYQEAVHLQPEFWNGYQNIMNALGSLGQEESIVPVARQMMKVAGGRPGRAPEHRYDVYDAYVWNLPTERTSVIANMASRNGIGGSGSSEGDNLTVALIDILMHDTTAASLRLMTTAESTQVDTVAGTAFARALIAEENGDSKGAIEDWDVVTKAYADPYVASVFPNYPCFAAPSYQKVGQPAKGDAALDAVGTLTFVDCYRFRGDVLDLRGDWPGAQAWYTKAVQLAPSSPAGYYSWGAALARHGDLAGAAAKYQLANQKGPYWADPLKGWGDVLMKQGHVKEALAKYEEALKYAPNWKKLIEARLSHDSLV